MADEHAAGGVEPSCAPVAKPQRLTRSMLDFAAVKARAEEQSWALVANAFAVSS
jgi:hypothetical protein